MCRRAEKFERSVIRGSEKPMLPAIKFFSSFQLRDLKRNKYHFGVSFCTVLVIVFAALTVTTIVEKSPIMFWKFAQTDQGEIDAYVYPKNSFINYTRSQQVMGKDYMLSPRKVYHSTLAMKLSKSLFDMPINDYYGEALLLEQQLRERRDAKELEEKQLNATGGKSKDKSKQPYGEIDVEIEILMKEYLNAVNGK